METIEELDIDKSNDPEVEVVEESTENTPEEGNEVLREFLEHIAPGVEFPSDDDRIAFLIQYTTEQDEALDAFAERMNENPEVKKILEEFLGGTSSLKASIASVISPDDLSSLEESDEDFKARAKEREEKKAERAKRESEREKNITKSADAIRAFQSKTGATDEDISELIAMAEKFYKLLSDGMIDEKDLEELQKLKNYDATTEALRKEADARFEDGRVSGRNEKIAIEKNLKASPVPALSGGGEAIDKGNTRGVPDVFLHAQNRFKIN